MITAAEMWTASKAQSIDARFESIGRAALHLLTSVEPFPLRIELRLVSMHRTPDSNPSSGQYSGTPRIVNMQVVPVAGQDSMLLNLSGAHGPYFTRNVVILTDNAGRQGV